MQLLQDRKPYMIITVSVLLCNYLLDQATKLIAFTLLRGKGTIKVLGDYFILIYTENEGAFLSLGANWFMPVKYTILLLLPIVICFIVVYYLMMYERQLRKIILMSTIVGGGVGNLVDRLFNDFKVIDFLNFGIGPVRTGVLNVADLSVTFGILILFIAELIPKKKR
ncbi:MAG: signal peptidase II [Treponema sp.]|jgi:signal peptidase II|nr:signal peptidase II [Treponema sp.]